MEEIKRDIVVKLERLQERALRASHRKLYAMNIEQVLQSEDLLELAHGILEDVSGVLGVDYADKQDMRDTVPDVNTAETIIWALWNAKEEK